jgi:nicotinamide-nucleotide amidase
VILRNGAGTAPGFYINTGNCMIVVLPGPPKEMKHIFENEVVKQLFTNEDFVNHSKFIKVFGMGESALEEALIDLIDNQTNPSIATYVKDGEVTVRLTAKVKSGNFSDDAFEPVLSEILKIIGNKVFSVDNEELHETCGNLLIKNNITIATAESCTGGLLAHKLTAVPGISSVFNAGFITYSNKAKIELLNVNPQTIEKNGAVSKETAVEMAKNARTKTQSSIGISITGIAGPDGGTLEKPVGLVFIGFSSAETDFYKELRLSGDRERIRNLTTLHALDIIRKYILKLEI